MSLIDWIKKHRRRMRELTEEDLLREIERIFANTVKCANCGCSRKYTNGTVERCPFCLDDEYER